MSELQSLLEQLADDGEARGADPVFAAATQRATRHRRARRRRRVLSSFAAVLAVVVGVAAIVRVTTTKSPAPEIRTRPTPVVPTTAGATAAQLVAGHWETLPAAPLATRTGASVVWTGTELLVWGGQGRTALGAVDKFYSDGAAYDPASKHWRRLPPAPIEFEPNEAVVWTGSEMLIWGAKGALTGYDPSVNRWRALPPSPNLGDAYAYGVWTGDRAVFLAGGAGGAYDPKTDTWSRLPDATGSPAASSVQLAVAAGAGRVLAWYIVQPRIDGLGRTDLVRYDERSNAWTRLTAGPAAISLPQVAIWTGERLFVRGDMHQPGALGPGPLPEVSAKYDPDTGVATRLPADVLTSGAAAGGFSSVWTGSALMSLNAQGEQTGVLRAGDASAYDPTTERWETIPSAGFGCTPSTPAWTGSVVLMYCSDPLPAQPHAVGGLIFFPGSTVGTAAHNGSLSGTFHMIGGPAPGVDNPLRGVVTAAGATYRVQVGTDGKFSLSVPSGRYTLSGTSPQMDSGADTCGGPSVSVRSDSAVRGVRVICSVP